MTKTENKDTRTTFLAKFLVSSTVSIIDLEHAFVCSVFILHISLLNENKLLLLDAFLKLEIMTKKTHIKNITYL